MPNTSSPGRYCRTPWPTASTTPDTSWPRIAGSPYWRNPPVARPFQSVGLTPAAWTATSISVGRGYGRGTMIDSSTSGEPHSRAAIACIVGRSVVDIRPPSRSVAEPLLQPGGQVVEHQRAVGLALIEQLVVEPVV